MTMPSSTSGNWVRIWWGGVKSRLAQWRQNLAWLLPLVVAVLLTIAAIFQSVRSPTVETQPAQGWFPPMAAPVRTGPWRGPGPPPTPWP
jgi:hypothetical protein